MDVTIGDAIPLYDGVAPGSEDWAHTQSEYFSEIFDDEVIANVVAPTVIPVLPNQPDGSAILIAPGGGYHALSMQNEGFKPARHLAARGISAFVLTYRTVPGGEDPIVEFVEKMNEDRAVDDMNAIAPLAVADGIKAMEFVKSHDGIDPSRVGMMGFSAGANVTLRLALTAPDAARPAYIAPVYPPVRGLTLTPPPPGTGPLFVVAATDDQLGLTDDAIEVYNLWRASGLSAELHLYATGGHGFGMRTLELPSDTWIDRFTDWLDSGAQALASLWGQD